MTCYSYDITLFTANYFIMKFIELKYLSKIAYRIIFLQFFSENAAKLLLRFKYISVMWNLNI